MIKLLRSLAVSVCVLFWASVAMAACTGQDMLPELRASDPDGIARVFAKAHSEPNGQGRFWRISGNGSVPSYLFGTFHSREAIATVPTEVWAAFDAARIAIFEMSLEEHAKLDSRVRSDVSFTRDDNLPPLFTELSQTQRSVVSRALTDRGLPPESANHMQPWLLAALLAYPPCHIQAMSSGEKFLDAYMADRAIENGIRETGLETYEQALAAFSTLDRDELLATIIPSDTLVQREEDLFRTNTELYARGETAAVLEFGMWLAERDNPPFDIRALSDRLMTGLLDDRHAIWMPKLVKHLTRGDAFVAVGALHLPGASGLIELLRAEGFTVERMD